MAISSSRRRNVLAILVALALCAPALAEQIARHAAAGLTIAGDVTKPQTFAVADLKRLPRTTVTADDHGTPVKYEGVLVSELLKTAGAPDRTAGSNSLATYVRASASDGYEVVFSLGELEQDLSGNNIIVADTADGKPLVEPQGPLRIVVPRDSRGARSMRMLVRLEIVRLKK
jgi:DMSO/TMAO reductase YedYZ molybdopterin-dependent catalytic subunit